MCSRNRPAWWVAEGNIDYNRRSTPPREDALHESGESLGQLDPHRPSKTEVTKYGLLHTVYAGAACLTGSGSRLMRAEMEISEGAEIKDRYEARGFDPPTASSD
jgi:hypothetical protein